MKILLNHSQVKWLYDLYPDHIGVLFSPPKTRFYDGKIPYSIDNGAFSGFDEKSFFAILDKSKRFPPPVFVVVPDVVGSHTETLNQWHKYASKVKSYGYPIAFVAQDGCNNANDIPVDCDWVFVGGTTPYKLWAIRNLISQLKKPVHVGRVNTLSRLWLSFNHGAASVDGSGWFREPGRARDRELIDFLDTLSGRSPKTTSTLFEVGAFCV